MNSNRKSAIIVGALFIITTIVGMVDAYFVAPILDTPNYLNKISANENQIILGAFLILAMSIGIVGIALMLFQVLKTHNETIAITYVSFRSIECVLLIVGAISYLFLITLSRQYINAGAPDASYFQNLGALAIQMRYSAYQIAMVILGLGSLMLCYLLYQSKLVPRFISIWGFVGYALLLASALLDISGIIDTVHGAGSMMYIPGGLFELFLFPIWLITKGFNPSAITSVSAE